MTEKTEEPDLFESTVTFEDDPNPPPAQPTEEEIYDQAFNAELNPEGAETAGSEETETKRLFERMTDDELQAVFDKARQVDDLNERLKKTHDHAFGRIGSIEGTLKELREQKPAAPVPVALNPEQFKHVSEYLDDDGLVQALVQDLSALQLGIPLLPNFDLEARLAEDDLRFTKQQETLTGELSKLRQEFEMKALSIVHPDWQEQLETPEFGEWQATLKPEDRQKLDESWDSRELSKAFSKFKDWKAKKAEFERNKQNTLEGNIPIKSNGAGRQQNHYASDYERGFNEGLRGGT
jgi:hypothetical protein